MGEPVGRTLPRRRGRLTCDVAANSCGKAPLRVIRVDSLARQHVRSCSSTGHTVARRGAAWRIKARRRLPFFDGYLAGYRHFPHWQFLCPCSALDVQVGCLHAPLKRVRDAVGELADAPRFQTWLHWAIGEADKLAPINSGKAMGQLASPENL